MRKRRRRYDREEVIHQRLEAQLRAAPDDPRAIRAYGEHLKARDEPLGRLMLLSLEAEAFEAECWRAAQKKGQQWWSAPPCRARLAVEKLITTHWYEWFDCLETDAVDFEWRHGLVRSAELREGALFRTLRHLLDAPPLQFLVSLDIGDFHGTLPRFFPETLKELVLPLWAAIDHGLDLSRFGEGLTFTGSIRELRKYRDQLRHSFPGVKLRPRLPEPAIDAMFCDGVATVKPRFVGRRPDLGTPTPEDDDRMFRYCAACTSDDTTLVFKSDNCWLSDTRTHFIYEYVCNECGFYTHYSFATQSPEFPRRRQVRQRKIKLAS